MTGSAEMESAAPTTPAQQVVSKTSTSVVGFTVGHTTAVSDGTEHHRAEGLRLRTRQPTAAAAAPTLAPSDTGTDSAAPPHKPVEPPAVVACPYRVGEPVLYTGVDGGITRATAVAHVSTNVPPGDEPEVSVQLPGGLVRDTVLARLAPASEAAGAPHDAPGMRSLASAATKKTPRSTAESDNPYAAVPKLLWMHAPIHPFLAVLAAVVSSSATSAFFTGGICAALALAMFGPPCRSTELWQKLINVRTGSLRLHGRLSCWRSFVSAMPAAKLGAAVLVGQAAGEFLSAGTVAALGHCAVWTIYDWFYVILLAAVLLVHKHWTTIQVWVRQNLSLDAVLSASRTSPGVACVLASVALWIVYERLYGILIGLMLVGALLCGQLYMLQARGYQTQKLPFIPAHYLTSTSIDEGIPPPAAAAARATNLFDQRPVDWWRPGYFWRQEGVPPG